MRVFAAVVAGGVVLAGGCGRPAAPRPSPAELAAEAAMERARQRGGDAARDLAGTLLPELQAALEDGGPASAIAVCAERAQELTAEVQARHPGVRIRRTSTRVRNPANAPDAWEKAWFESVGDSATGWASVAVRGVDELGRDEVRYLQPLVMAELCLPCHGPAEQIDPRVRAVLEERYPGDRATGFAVGELRGVISVRVPIE